MAYAADPVLLAGMMLASIGCSDITRTNREVHLNNTAQAALLILRGSVNHSQENEGFVFLPSQTSLTLDEATLQLAALPKPVACRAEQMNRYLGLRCSPLAGRRLDVHAKASDDMTTWIRTTLSKVTSWTPDSLIELRTVSESLVLTIGDLLAVIKDYSIPWSASLVEADYGATQRGALAICSVTETVEWRSEGPRGIIRSARSK